MPKGITRFLIYAAILLIAIAGFNEASGLGIEPVWILLAALGLPCLLIALAKYPAAFFVPMLFLSRQKELPIPAPIRNVIDITALPLGAALLVVALIIRLIDRRSRRGTFSLGELFRGQGKGITAFLLLAGVVTISYLYTRAPGYGGDKLVSLLTAGSLMFFAPFVILEDERDFRHFAIGTVAFSLMLAFARIAAGSQGAFGQHEEVTHIGIGQLMGMAILLVLNYKFVESRAGRFLLILCLPVLAAGLIAAEARGPLLAVLAIFAMLFTRRREMSLISPRTAVVGLAVILAALVIVPEQWFRGEAATKFQTKRQELVDFTQGGDYSEKGSGGRRLVFYQAALDGIAEKPVAGWGVGGWATYYWHNDAWEYPHNLFLEVTLEEGLLGLAAFLALLALGFGAAKEAFDEASGRFAFVLPILAYSVLIAMVSGDIDDSRFLWFWCSVAFVAWRMIKTAPQEEVPADPALES